MRLGALLFLTLHLWASGPETDRGRQLFEHRNYKAAVEALAPAAQSQDAEALLWLGKSLVMTGDLKRATEVLTRAAELQSQNSDIQHWLGRAYGRRAEASNPLAAAGLAGKAREAFEAAVKSNPRNLPALVDLFEYYVEAPGIMGGGLDKAEDIAEKIRPLSATRYQFAQARIAEKKKDFTKAEEHFRKAVDVAPKSVTAWLDLGRLLAKQSRYDENEQAFGRAEQLDARQPRILYERANAYMRAKTNADKARELLQRYVRSRLGPDDPTVADAQGLLKQIL